MLKLEWNALRRGDRVAMHDDRAADLPLLDAVVTIVERGHGSNDVAVIVNQAGSGREVIRPRRSAVHLVPLDPLRSCWRCDTIATADRDHDTADS